MKRRANLVPNPNHEIRKTKQKHNKCKQKSNKILLQKRNKTKL
jgi:hypothetical protein